MKNTELTDYQKGYLDGISPFLHKDQLAIIELLLSGQELEGKTLRYLGQMLGGIHQESVRHHISRLVKFGVLDVEKGKYVLSFKAS